MKTSNPSGLVVAMAMALTAFGIQSLNHILEDPHERVLYMALLIFMALVLVYIYQSVSASYEYTNDSSLRIDERKSIKNVGIILAGLGSVGQTFLKNIFDRIVDACDHPALHHIQVGVAAIGDSKGYIFHQRGFSWTEIQSILDLKTSNRPISNTVADLETLIKELTQPRSDTDICCFDSYIIVDCTASSSIIEPLIIAKKAGFGVVLANKIPLSDDQHLYNRLVMTNKQRSPLVRYEATVGAGLPVIDALKRVVASGDKILSVQGSLSGTLGYVVSLLNRGESFSYALEKAREQNIPESDPRIDLSGMDVARKLVIVAREMNLNCDISSVEIEELIPSALMNRNHSVDKFLNDLSSVNPIFQEKAYTTLKNRKRLAYLGTVNSNGKIRIALEEVVNDSVFANPKDKESAIAITSEWFPVPIFIQGIGAGPQVTCAALLADVVQLCQYLSSVPSISPRPGGHLSTGTALLQLSNSLRMGSDKAPVGLFDRTQGQLYVKIHDYELALDEKNKQYVVFVIHLLFVETPGTSSISKDDKPKDDHDSSSSSPASRRHVAIIRRRYSQFVSLHRKLKEVLPSYQLPKLPSTRLWNRFERDYLHDKMQRLQKYLLDVCQYVSIPTPTPAMGAVLDFLDVDNQFLQEDLGQRK